MLREEKPENTAMPVRGAVRNPEGVSYSLNYIFDFDGTIADSLEAFIAVFNKNIRENKDPLSPEEIQLLRSMSSRRAIRSLGVRWWQIPKLIARGLPDFRALVPSLNTFNGLPSTLKELQGRGDKLFIVTSNTKGSVDTFLQVHQIDKYFTDVDTGAGIFKKAKHIRGIIAKHQLLKNETVYIGDETRDIQAARFARVKIVSVTWGFNTVAVLKKRRPNYLIDNPEQLLDIKL